MELRESIRRDDRQKCTKCKYYKLYPPDPVLIYSSPKHRCTAITDLVTGDTIETDCYAMRRIRSECGPNATLFVDAPANGGTAALSPSVEERGRGGLNALLFFGFLAILALAFLWAYEHDKDQPSVIKTGTVSVKNESRKDGSCCVTARTRLQATGNRSFWQFEASPGEWKDCGDDCEKALRKALAGKVFPTASSRP